MVTTEPSSEAEAGSVNIAEPEAYSNLSSPKSEPQINAEPIPEWPQAIQSWGFAWDFHLYGIGAIFIVIAVLSLFCLMRLLVHKHGGSNQKKVSVLLQGFLVAYGTSRSVFLCVDAYHHKKILPIPVLNVIWGIAQPCLITSYILLFVVLRNALRLKQRFQTWFTSRNIALVTVPHFLFVFGAELIVSFSPQYKILTFLCQLLYTLFSLILATIYTSVSILIWKSVFKMKNNSTHSVVSSDNRINRIFYTCIGSVIGGLLIGGTQVYVMTGPFSVFSSKDYASAWPWYWLTTSSRLLEVYMVMLLFFISHHQSSKGSTIRVKVAAAAQDISGQRWATEKV